MNGVSALSFMRLAYLTSCALTMAAAWAVPVYAADGSYFYDEDFSVAITTQGGRRSALLLRKSDALSVRRIQVYYCAVNSAEPVIDWVNYNWSSAPVTWSIASNWSGDSIAINFDGPDERIVVMEVLYFNGGRGGSPLLRFVVDEGVVLVYGNEGEVAVRSLQQRSATTPAAP